MAWVPRRQIPNHVYNNPPVFCKMEVTKRIRTPKFWRGAWNCNSEFTDRILFQIQGTAGPRSDLLFRRNLQSKAMRPIPTNMPSWLICFFKYKQFNLGTIYQSLPQRKEMLSHVRFIVSGSSVTTGGTPGASPGSGWGLKVGPWWQVRGNVNSTWYDITKTWPMLEAEQRNKAEA